MITGVNEVTKGGWAVHCLNSDYGAHAGSIATFTSSQCR
jgi:hypothetical protein